MTNRTRQLLWPIMYPIVWLIFIFLGPVRSFNRRNVPKEGGILILSNHLADCDPVIVQLGCRRHVKFMAKSELFEMRILGALIRWLEAFPVKRGEPDRAAIKQAVEYLKQGYAVCVFPEGQLSEDGKLQPILPGAALIARMADVPIICCGLRNTNQIMPYGTYIPRPAFRWVDCRWGHVRKFDRSASAEEVVGWVHAELSRLV
ncbi:MAG: hypothetical protein HONBIEJF_01742 [Fimbriimonadaceae bacterium]|nr:hypothetical protein [Fimbriimonadaceae bacterium]